MEKDTRKMTEDFLKFLELARLHGLSYEVVNTFVRNLDNPEKVFATMIEACADWDLI
jgi:hypothetical protein